MVTWLTPCLTDIGKNEEINFENVKFSLVFGYWFPTSTVEEEEEKNNNNKSKKNNCYDKT